MPPLKRITEPTQNGKAEGVVTPEEQKKPAMPWSSPSSVIDRQGLSAMLFALPGMGKTTLGLTMLNSDDGGPMLIVNFDEELRSISDLGPDSGVMVWPGEAQGGKIRNWSQIDSFCSKLLTGKHPFKSVMFDTLNSAYDKFALPDVKARNPGARDPRQIYGEANDMIIALVRNFCAVAREQGLNVLFVCHAEEKQVGENGPIYIRPKITPGVVQGINQQVSLIGYLSPPGLNKPRTLQLSPSKMIASKIHQPRTGPQLPEKIVDPDLGKLIDHLKRRRPYPKRGKDSD